LGICLLDSPTVNPLLGVCVSLSFFTRTHAAFDVLISFDIFLEFRPQIQRT
jgi:hypothetical protein